ncbi:ATP-dependent zinc protease [Ferrimonas senticii]|uniref:ATP-dependent zinc protease family protein n=1 Tax=Ferrimonas senticii TaxID=394566 RepID=UPI0003FBA4FA|nr:RimK/LysX family protein [Ferrimonas senticii]
MRKWLLLLTPFIASGCAITERSATVTPEQLSNAFSTQQQQLQLQWAEQQQAQAAQHTQQQQQLLEQLQQLQQQLTTMQQQQLLAHSLASEAVEPIQVDAPACIPAIVEETQKKMIFGEAEMVTAPDFERNFAARVDTGATGSSLGVQNLAEFERDGENWVSFQLPAVDDKRTDFEAKVVRTVQIKKAVEGQKQRRPVIEVRLQIGDFNGITEVNLTDRSHMEFPLLLGRKFFKDIAVVDVSKQYVQSAEE